MTDPEKSIQIQLRISQFELPPVRDALVVGSRALIGSKAIQKALDEMMPGKYELLDVEHDGVQSIIVRSSVLRKIPRERIVEVILRQVEPILDPTDTIHVAMDIEIRVRDEIRLPR